MKIIYLGFLVGAISHRIYSVYKVFSGEQPTSNNTLYLVFSFFILATLFYLLNNNFLRVCEKC